MSTWKPNKTRDAWWDEDLVGVQPEWWQVILTVQLHIIMPWIAFPCASR